MTNKKARKIQMNEAQRDEFGKLLGVEMEPEPEPPPPPENIPEFPNDNRTPDDLPPLPEPPPEYSGTAGTQGSLVSVEPPDYSDTGNSIIFQREYGKDLIWVDALGWLAWDGRYWDKGKHGVQQLARQFTNRMLDEAITKYQAAMAELAKAEAGKITTISKETASAAAAAKQRLDEATDRAKAAKGYLKHANWSRDQRTINRFIESTSHFVTKPADQLDMNPFDLNTPAGIVDLRTGEIRPHEREAYCTHITTVSPERNHSGDTLWNDFLNDVTCGDADVKHFLQVVAGMALIGAVCHEGIILLYGDGLNGKTTFTNAITAVLGTKENGYAGDLPAQVLTTDRNNKLAHLETIRGKRMVTVSELDADAQLSESMLKTIANRKDVMTVERKYKDPEQVVPTHTVLLDTNHLPHVHVTDKGTWRRLTVVPFNAHFKEGDRPNFDKILVGEAGPAILQWMIDGAAQFVKDNYQLKTPQAVLEATDRYKNSEDSVLIFLDECTQRTGKCGAMELYTTYQEWMQKRGSEVHTLSLKEFNERLRGLKFEERHPGNKLIWKGLSLDRNRK